MGRREVWEEGWTEVETIVFSRKVSVLSFDKKTSENQTDFLSLLYKSNVKYDFMNIHSQKALKNMESKLTREKFDAKIHHLL